MLPELVSVPHAQRIVLECPTPVPKMSPNCPRQEDDGVVGAHWHLESEQGRTRYCLTSGGTSCVTSQEMHQTMHFVVDRRCD